MKQKLLNGLKKGIKRIFSNKIIKYKIVIIVIFAFLSSWRLLRPGFYSMQDDIHVFRLQQFSQCLSDGQIPCRQIADGGFGYSYPLFNFYSPFFYFLSYLFSCFGFSLISSIKISLILLNIIGILGIYLLSNKLFKNKYTSLLATTLFTFFPYRATDIYVRGAFAEFSAISLIPITLYLYYSYSNKMNKTNLFFTTLFSTFLFLSHNLIALLSLPIIVFFIFYPKFEFKFKKLIPLLLSLAISSFFLIPAIFEKKYITIDTMTQAYFDFRAHFTTLKQLFFDRSWGYGASLWGPVDDMSFQVGLPHWPLALLAIFLFIKKNKKNKSESILILCLTSLTILSLFMTHNKSTFIWTAIPFLKYFQFPWRFLSITTISVPLLAATIIKYLKFPFQKYFTYLIILITILLNINYFKEDIYFPKLIDQDKLTKSEVLRQSGAGLKDYWPKFGQNFPTTFAPTQPISRFPDTQIISYQKTSNKISTTVNIIQPSDQITLPLAYFPGWQLTIDNQLSDFVVESNLGLIQTPQLNTGQHTIKANLKSTTIQKFSNLISILATTVLLILIIL